jgi:hypothetical protein
MDGPFYLDARAPFLTFDFAAVTLAATDKALYSTATFPVLGSNYFAFGGKKLRVRCAGRMTTAATPGNGTFSIYWGSGADATGTILAASEAFTLIASQTNAPWQIDITTVVRTLGTTGVMYCSGNCLFAVGLVAARAGIIPSATPAGVTVDTTANNIVSVQFKRSGSTAETMQVQDMDVVAYN